MSYPNDIREAVIMVAKPKDGKIIHIKTVAEPLN